ncbi:putative DNA primase [Erwinia phage Loshitsa2]|uniref:DNA primase n=1 Tax=Erwinia phage Loshitsa2 TaxID=2923254 RepID=A0AAE9FHN6_9CAUD|nr:putative DNA primase [Erwinia phage Loshitsa2]
MIDAPWLRACKRLPVGGSARIRCCGRDKAAVIYNKEASWEMYCNRCKQPQFERKQFVQQIKHVVERPVQPAPADLIRIGDASAEVQNAAYSLLATKGIMPDMVEDVLWSNASRRMVFPISSSLYLGRAMTPAQHPKWVQYNGKSSFGYIAPLNQPVQGIVLTEDLLSAKKVAHASNRFGSGNIVVVALLGTRLDQKLKLLIAQNNWPVLLMLDGDTAGYDGIKRIRRELKAFSGLRVGEFTRPGDDPKDLEIATILEALNGFFDYQRNDEPQSLGPSA